MTPEERAKMILAPGHAPPLKYLSEQIALAEHHAYRQGLEDAATLAETVGKISSISIEQDVAERIAAAIRAKKEEHENS